MDKLKNLKKSSILAFLSIIRNLADPVLSV